VVYGIIKHLFAEVIYFSRMEKKFLGLIGGGLKRLLLTYQGEFSREFPHPSAKKNLSTIGCFSCFVGVFRGF
jgi:hypothetical protein